MTGPRSPLQVVRRPLLMAATGFCVGALFDRAPPSVAIAAFVGLLVVTGALARRRRVLAALLIPALFWAAGMVAAVFRLPAYDDFAAAKEHPGAQRLLIEGRVADAPDWGPDGHRLVVDLVGTSTSPVVALQPAQGRIRLTVTGTRAPCGAPGDRIRAWTKVRPYIDPGFPGGEGRRARVARQGITLRGFVSQPGHCLRVARAPAVGGALIERVRARIQGAVRRILPGRSGALVRALAIGDRSGLSDETRQAFQRSGLAHLLAVSGLHLAVVSGLLVLVLVSLFRRWPRVALGIGAHRAAALAALPAVALYTELVGAPPSAVRAAIMVGALLLGHAFVRLAEAWSGLALAVLLMAAWDPAMLGDPGFQLSFAAVAALLRIQPALVERLGPGRHAWPKVFRVPFELVMASAAATIGTMPLVLRHFGVLPVAGLLANLPAAPLASGVVVPLSLFGGLLAAVSETVATPVLQLAGASAELLEHLARGVAEVPGAAVHLPRPSILECILFYGATIGFTLPGRRRRGPRRVAWACLAALGLSLLIHGVAPAWSKEVRVTFLPVGQGDAAVVELPGGEVLVVDVGPGGAHGDAAERVIVPFLRHRRIQTVRAVVLSHAHADHSGGLASLAESVVVEEVWWTGDVREGPEGLAKDVARIGARRVQVGQTPLVAGPATVRVLGPVAPAESYGDVNDGSVVLSIEIGERRILLAGDAEEIAEQDMLRRCAPCLRADVLKAGHHGSRSSTKDAFMSAVRPRHVILSLGRDNRFGFPHREVVQRLRAYGAEAWRTDEDGAITVITDGQALSVTGYRPRAAR